MDLTGRTALVTGGSGDIGAAISMALAKLGANVLVHTYQNLKAAKLVVERIKKLGKNAKILQANLLKREEVFRMSDEILSMGSLDILVNLSVTIAPDVMAKKCLSPALKVCCGLKLVVSTTKVFPSQ